MRKLMVTLFTGMNLLVALALTNCTKNTGDIENNSDNNVSKGLVTGVVKDAKGNPVAGAKVRIENDYTYFDVTTDAKGIYRCTVSAVGSFKALAWASVSYQGTNYMLRAGMYKAADYEYFNPENGMVRNFQLQHNGRIPDRTAGANGSGYFGASINFYKLGGIYGPQLEEGDVITYTLTPDGPLMDGTAGAVLQGSFTIHANLTEYFAVDIPAGKYKVEAVLTRTGNTYRVYVGSFAAQNESMEIVPRADDYGVGNYENGFMTPANVVYMSVR
jgi:hypothetical protein